MALSNRVVRGATAVFAGRLLGLLSKGLLLLLLTRYLLTPEEYGLLFLTISVLGVTALFSDLGFAKSAARFLSDVRKDDPEQVPHVLRSALAMNVVAIVVVSAAILVFADRIAALVDTPAVATLLSVGTLYLVGHSLFVYVSLGFQGLNRVHLSSVVRVVANVGLLVGVVAFLVLGFGIRGAVVGYAAGYLLSAAVGFWLLRPHLAGSSPDGRRPGLARNVFRYSLPLTLTKGANVLDKRVDIVLVGVFLTPVAVGYYTLARQLAGFLVAPASSLGFAVSPSLGDQQSAGKLEEAARLYEATVEYVLLLYLPAVGGVVLVAEPMVRHVVGTDYLGAVPVIQVLSLYVLLIALDKVTNDGLDFLGRARARAVAKGVASGGNVLLNVLLIPRIGVVGAAVATVTTQALLVAIELRIMARELPIDPGHLLRTGVRTGVLALATTAGIWLVRPYASSTLPGLAGLVVGAAVLWALLAVGGGFVDPEAVREYI